MAATVVAAPPPAPTRHSPPQSYAPSATTSMPNTPPSTTTSPTTLHSHLHVRQLRPQKQPLYTPACLRPTEPLTKPKDIPERPRAPDTPPQSKESSFDSGRSRAGSNVAGDIPIVTSPIQSDLDIFPGDFGRIPSEAFDELGRVTGPPTVAHWKPDASTASCAICKTHFTWYLRRHHCRRCGDLVCGAHLLHTVPLDQNARLHPQGTISKACDACWRGWRAIKRLRHSRASSLLESPASSHGTLQPPVPIPQQTRPELNTHVGSMARSEGMIWSTF